MSFRGPAARAKGHVNVRSHLARSGRGFCWGLLQRPRDGVAVTTAWTAVADVVAEERRCRGVAEEALRGTAQEGIVTETGTQTLGRGTKKNIEKTVRAVDLLDLLFVGHSLHGTPSIRTRPWTLDAFIVLLTSLLQP